MRNLCPKILTAMLTFLMVSSGARAQFLWKVVLPTESSIHNFNRSYQALSCFGDNCIVVGTMYDSIGLRVMFWRSGDGGDSWVMEDPHIAAQNLSGVFSQVEQIDSLNIVAIGYSGIMLRTFDGGKTWVQQNSNTTNTIVSVHFSDPASGIFTCRNTDGPVFTTTDSGSHWNPVIFADSILTEIALAGGAWQCHSFGNGRFSILISGLGPLFSTTDNWNTMKSSSLLVDSTIDQWKSYGFGDCRFRGTDTIIAFGSFREGTNLIFHAAITRSVDGGMHWDKPYKSLFAGGVASMTDIDKDTIYAITDNQRRLLMSADAGSTWQESILQLDTLYSVNNYGQLSRSRNGLIALMDSNTSTVIVKGRQSISGINSYSGTIGYNQRVYPNPATTTLNIVSVEASTPYKIIDVLGRTVMSGMVLDHNTLTLDISGLPKGLYYVLVERADIPGDFVIVGKVATIGK